MTKVTIPVIPGEQRETRNPGTENWIPAGVYPEPVEGLEWRTAFSNWLE